MQLRMGLKEEVAFVSKMYQGVAEYEDMTEEERRLFKKCAKEKEREREGAGGEADGEDSGGGAAGGREQRLQVAKRQLQRIRRQRQAEGDA